MEKIHNLIYAYLPSILMQTLYIFRNIPSLKPDKYVSGSSIQKSLIQTRRGNKVQVRKAKEEMEEKEERGSLERPVKLAKMEKEERLKCPLLEMIPRQS